jgi:hypothetical protein
MLRYDTRPENRPQNANEPVNGPQYVCKLPRGLPPELPGTVRSKQPNHSTYGMPTKQDPVYVAACWVFFTLLATVVFAGMLLLMGLPIGVVIVGTILLVLVSLGDA